MVHKTDETAGMDRQRRFYLKPGWAMSALLWLLLVTATAWTQAPAPYSSVTGDRWRWLLYPIEVDAAARFQSAPAALYGLHVEKEGQRAWAVGGGGTILATDDGGLHWNSQTSGVQIDLRAVTFLDDGQHGWVVGFDGQILATADGGSHWEAQDSGTHSYLFDVIFVADGQHGWAVTEDGDVLATANGGRNWDAQVKSKKGSLASISFAPDGQRGWAVGQLGSIFSTNDGGQHWDLQVNGAKGELNAVSFAKDGQWGWIVGKGGTVLATIDGGERWDSQTSGVVADLEAVTFAADGKKGWATGGGGTIVGTTDGGRHWSPQKSGSLDELWSVAFAADGRRGWAVGANGTIVMTADGGQQWHAQTSGAPSNLNFVTFTPDGLHGWAVGGGGTIVATADGGRSWKTQASGDEATLSSIAFTPDAHEGWAAGAGETIMTTQDGGRNWKPQKTNANEHLQSVTFASDGRRGWAAGDNGKIVATVDGGQKWESQISDTSADLNAISFAADGQHGWAVGSSGTIVGTGDGGLHWKQQATLPTTYDLQAVVFADDNQHGWAVGGGGSIVATIDGGSTWNALPSLPVTLYSIALVGGGNLQSEALIVAGTSGVLARSSDGGNTFTFTDSKTGSSRLSLWASSTDHRVWCAGYPPMLLVSDDGGRTWKPQASPLRYQRYPAGWYWASLFLLPVLARRSLRHRADATLCSATAMGASDAPVGDFHQDCLQFGPLARGISRFLRNDATEPPLTVAISGEWGSGKSTLMRLVCADLERFGCKPVWFNAWHHQNDDQLLAALLTAVRNQALPAWFSLDGIVFRLTLLCSRSAKHYALLVGIVSLLVVTTAFMIYHDTDAWDRIAAYIVAMLRGENNGDAEKLIGGLDWLGVFGHAGGFLTTLVVLLRALRAFGADPAVLLLAATSDSFRMSDAKAATTFRSQFAKEFLEVAEALPYRMVIVVDDLDRCKPEVVLTVMEGVNFLMSSGPCFVIFGMATHRVHAALAMSFEKIAKEVVGLPSETAAEAGDDVKLEDAERERRRCYARDYLEKLINIEITVPRRDDLPARLLLQKPEAQERDHWRDTARRARRFLPAAGLVLAMTLAWIVGSNFDGFADRRPHWVVLPILPRTSAAASAPVSSRLKPASVVRDATTEPARSPASSSFRSPAVQPGHDEPISSFVMLTPAIVVLLLLSLFGVWRLREYTYKVQDSPAFSRALEAWAPVIHCNRHTPRAVKRFGNRVRYLTMLQQAEQLDESGWDLLLKWIPRKWLGMQPHAEPEVPESRSTALKEHRIVALSAFQDIYGDGWRQAVVSYRPSRGEPSPLDRAIASYTMGTNSEWPPSDAELDAFEMALKGVRLPGDRTILPVGRSIDLSQG